MSTQSLPSFSICIPIYNHGRYIADTIQSVLDQTYPHFEIVIADNASTDDSVEQIQKFNDPRIKLYRNRYNIGFAPNLQRVTSYATNDYLNLLSSDDQMKPNALETFANVICSLDARPENLILYSDTELFENSGKVVGYRTKSPKRHSVSTYFTDKLPAPPAEPYFVFDARDVLADALGNLKTYTSFLSLVYSRSLWQSVEGYNAVRTIGPDKFFAFKLLSQNPTVIYVPQMLYRYREYVSDNRAAEYTTLKHAIDDYLYTLENRDAALEPLGLSQQTLIETFIDRVCLQKGLSELGYQDYSYGFRMLAFSLASYPGTALRNRKFYVLLALLLTGPLAKIIAPLLLAQYHRTREV